MTKKTNRNLMIITTLLCILPIIWTAFYYNKLPEQMPIHFNAAGDADGFAPKTYGAFLLPLILTATNVVLHLVLNADPKRKNTSKAMLLISKWFTPILGIILQPVIVFNALGADLPITNIVMSSIGVLFIMMGNYMPKSRQNYTVGIKLPWTLHSEDNWNKTHRLAGYLWIIGGIFFVVIDFITESIAPLMIVIFALAIVPSVYSYLLYRKGI